MFSKTAHFVAILTVLIGMGSFATDIYLPALPAITLYFGVGEHYTQMTLSSYLLSFSLTPLIFGPYSDYVGRKKVILGGLMLGLLATLFCIIAPNMFSLIVARFFQGIGFGAVGSSARAMMPDKFKGVEMAKYSSVVAMTIPAVLVLAPAIGGLLQEYFSWHATFIFLAAYAFVMLLWVSSKAEETLEEKHPFKLTHRIYHELCKNKPFVLYGLIPCFTFAGIAAYISISPFLFQDLLGVSAAHYGFFACFTGGGVIAGGCINIKCLKKFKLFHLLQVGVLVQFIGGLGLLLCSLLGFITVATTLVFSIIYFMGFAFTFSNGFASAFNVLTKHYGSAGALLSAAQVFAGFLTIAACSLLPTNATSLASGFLLFASGIMVCLFLLRKHQQ